MTSGGRAHTMRKRPQPRDRDDRAYIIAERGSATPPRGRANVTRVV
jgi:hypothetical protein